MRETEESSDKVIKVTLAVLKSNMQPKRFGIAAPGLVKVRKFAIHV